MNVKFKMKDIRPIAAMPMAPTMGPVQIIRFFT
jgi:hypothetical protein